MVVIDALENRDVATADVAGAHLQTEMTNLSIVKVVRAATKIMYDVNKTFSKYITREKGKKVIYT